MSKMSSPNILQDLYEPEQPMFNQQNLNQIERKSISKIKIIKHQQTSKIENKSNRLVHQLPINLFRSAADYRKILITNGKYFNDVPTSIDGVIHSLQYLNAPIYESQQLKSNNNRLQYQSDIKSRNKKQNIRTQKKIGSNFTKCCCCCCDQFCETCLKGRTLKRGQFNSCVQESEAKTTKIIEFRQKKRQKRLSKIIKERQNDLLSNQIQVQKVKDRQSNIIKKKRHISLGCMKKLQQSNFNPRQNYENIFSNSQSHNKSINNLMMKSMYKWAEQKRQKKIQEIKNKKKKQEEAQYIRQWSEDVRLNNRRCLSKSPAKTKQIKNQPKHLKAIQYWESIRHHLQRQIRQSRTKYPSVDKKHKITKKCHSFVKIINPQQIQALKQKYEQQAKRKIREQKLINLSNKKRINASLKKLQKQRNKIINQCSLKPFKPSNEQIDNAFKNLNCD